VQNFKVLANRNLGSSEVPGKFGDQNTALVSEQIEDGATSFFVEHAISLLGDLPARIYSPTEAPFRYPFLFISFCFVCPMGIST